MRNHTLAILLGFVLLPWSLGCGGGDDASHADPSHDGHSESVAHNHADDGAHGDAGHGDATNAHADADVSHADAGHGEPSAAGQHAATAASHGDASHSHSGDQVAPRVTGASGGAAHAEQEGHGEEALPEKVKVKSGDGKTRYSIKWRTDGAKLVDAEERELARYTTSEHKLKVKDPEDKVLGYIVGNAREGRVKVEGPDQETELFKLIRQEDGDWKLEDNADKLLIRIKKRDYGYELEAPDDKSLSKVKPRNGKTSLRDPADKTVLYTQSPIDALAFACLGLDVIQDERMRAALAVHLQLSHAAAHAHAH
ncbi:MAG: hypothetical protein KDB14_15145 [Planctomycetales bacterium]|nr:hypothetical protein [Planctomycetales bacterium]